MSVCGLTQAPEQLVNGGQLSWQLPALQTRIGPHAVPQAPQFDGFDVRSTHVPLQSVEPTGQPQVPFWHSWPTTQALPQVPQFRGSLERATHAPVQLVSAGFAPQGGGGGMTDPSGPASVPVCINVHVPVRHTLVVMLHLFPQAPQPFGSLKRLVQTPLQSTSPG
jgi:hypothetical protein